MSSVLDNDKTDLFGEKNMDTSPALSGQTTTVAKQNADANKQSDEQSVNPNTMTTKGEGLTSTTVNISNPTNSASDITDTVGPVSKRPKIRPTPYAKPILLTSDRRSRSRKTLSWPSDDRIQAVKYFEWFEDERVNVSKYNNQEPNLDHDSGPSQGRMPTTAAIDIGTRKQNGRSESDSPIEYSPWRPLIPIDFTPTLPSPGWNSIERTAQAEREVYVLGAIDLPGKPSTLDEPDSASTATKDDPSEIKEIPLENPDGMYTEYPDMHNCDIVNGVKQSSDNTPTIVQSMTPYIETQQPQLLSNQFQQQLVQATSQNPFSFQEMSAQFQQQQQQQQPPLPFTQQPIQTPFMNPGQAQQLQQEQIQPQPQNNLAGPIMPWLSYPFNTVSENSHAHLFRRPTT